MATYNFRAVRERDALTVDGFLALFVMLALSAWTVWLFVEGIRAERVSTILWASGLATVLGICCAGFFAVQPNESRVLIFFGRYIGSCRKEGFRFGNPLTMKPRVSLRVRNLTSEQIKVNDASGSPIEIAAVVVWRVVDSARALFDVDAYEAFVSIQVETAVRSLATNYPYEPPDEDDAISLRGDQEQIAKELRRELQERLKIAGVEVQEARLTHLAYAPEIAQAMLRRQQAQAVVAARRLIVEAAVSMVDQALQKLADERIVDLDEERKAAMVNNLMVVLTSEQSSAPVLNTGTLYG